MNSLKERIEEYINNEMSVEERLAFEQLLETDEELSNLVHDGLKLKQELDTLRLRTKVQRIGKEITSSEKNQQRLRIIGIAASVVLLITSAIFFYETSHTGKNIENDSAVSLPSNNTNYTDSSQVAKTQQLDTQDTNKFKDQSTALVMTEKNRNWLTSNLIVIDLSILRELDNDTSSAGVSLNEAYQQLNQSQYTKAIQTLKRINQNYDPETIAFLKGICYFKLNDYQSAKQLFAMLRSKHLYHFDAEWNYLLCLYLLDQSDEAKTLLGKISSDKSHPYHSKAIALEKSMR